MYRAIGKDGLLTMGVKRTKYDYETKVAAAKAVVDGGMSKPEAMVHFGIASATPLKQWCRLYRQGGAQALKPKPKGRPKGSVRAVPPNAVRRNSKSVCASLRHRCVLKNRLP